MQLQEKTPDPRTNGFGKFGTLDLDHWRQLVEGNGDDDPPKPSRASTGQRIAAALERLVSKLDALTPNVAVDGPGDKEGDRREPESPSFTGEEAAKYLRITMNALYNLVERRKLKPLPGTRKYRFIKEQLDAFLRGK